jgi:hypothetical protein
MITESSHKHLFKDGKPVDKYVSFWDEKRKASSYYVWTGNEYIIQETPVQGIFAAQNWMIANFPGYAEDHQ